MGVPAARPRAEARLHDIDTPLFGAAAPSQSAPEDEELLAEMHALVGQMQALLLTEQQHLLAASRGQLARPGERSA